jgi:hypothetical protein
VAGGRNQVSTPPNQIFGGGEEVKIEIKDKIPQIVIPKIKINF